MKLKISLFFLAMCIPILAHAAAHGVLVGTSTNTTGVTAVGVAGQVLTSNGDSSDPSFQDAVAFTATSITNKTDLSTGWATGDWLSLVDISDTTDGSSGTLKKFTIGNLFTSPTIVTPTINAIATAAGSNGSFTATIPAQTTSAQAGKSLTFTASDARDGSSSHAPQDGGSITLTPGVPVNSGNYGSVIITDAAGTNDVNGPAFKIGSFGYYIDSSGKLISTSSGQNVSSNIVGSSWGFATRSDGLFGFVNSTNASTGTPDVAIGRAAAGILEVNTATSGTLSTIRLANVQGNNTVKALTESSATTFVKITMTSGSSASGTIRYSIEANDASDFQARSGSLQYNAVDTSGTITCSVSTQGSANEVAAVSTGTLTNTFTCADATSNVLDIKANAVSSLTQTTLQIRYRVEELGTNTITPQ